MEKWIKKVAVTADAEAETKLPVEEVVEAVEEMHEEVAEQLEKKNSAHCVSLCCR